MAMLVIPRSRRIGNRVYRMFHSEQIKNLEIIVGQIENRLNLLWTDIKNEKLGIDENKKADY